MSKDFLTQEEVDLLLKGVMGEAEEQEQHAEPEAGVKPYRFGSQERTARGRMHTMEIINARFARLFRIAFFNLTRRTADVSVGQIRIQQYSEFIRNLPIPANFNVVRPKPLRGHALFIFDPNLIFQVVDNMFGGDGRFHTRVEGREFTQTEQRIIQRLLAAVFESYGKAWEPVYPLEFEFVRSEMNSQFASVTTPSEAVVVTTFDIEFGGAGGALHILMPHAMIEPIRELLYSPVHGEQMTSDTRWLRTLSRQIQSAEIELAAILGHASVTLDQVLKMRSGDIIPLDKEENLVAEVDGVPVIEGKYGVSNGRYALKVEKILATKIDGTSDGDKHA